MATATLTFNLDDPEERRDHYKCVHAIELSLVVWDFNEWLKGKLKHEELSDEREKAYKEVMDKLHEIVLEYQVHNLIFD